jgi:hypothetical protein
MNRMASNPDQFREPADKSGTERNEIVQERVRELTWALLDQYASDDDLQLLDSLLLSDDGARQAYLGCVQLHSDLLAHFVPKAETVAATSNVRPPVLGLLDNSVPTIGGASQVAEE